MKNSLIGFAGLALCAGLAACGTAKDPAQLTQRTVQYSCGQGGEIPLTVQYTFQGDEALAAKVIYQNQAVDLTRASTTNADMVGNTFRGNGYTWTTEKFTSETVGSTNGNMLTHDVQQDVNGQSSMVSNIVANNCKVAA